MMISIDSLSLTQAHRIRHATQPRLTRRDRSIGKARLPMLRSLSTPTTIWATALGLENQSHMVCDNRKVESQNRKEKIKTLTPLPRWRRCPREARRGRPGRHFAWFSCSLLWSGV